MNPSCRQIRMGTGEPAPCLDRAEAGGRLGTQGRIPGIRRRRPSTPDALPGRQRQNLHGRFTLFSLALAALLTLPAPPRAAALDLSFSAGLERLTGHSAELAAASRKVENRRESIAAARGLYWPQVAAQTRFTRMDDPIVLDLNDIRQVILKLHPAVPASAVPNFTMEVQDRDFWRSEVALTWPVFTGGRITAANDFAEAGLAGALAEGDRTRQRLTAELVRRYFGLQVALQVLEVRREILRDLAEHVRQAKRLEEEGLIARVERLHAEVAQAEADREAQGAQKDVEIARIALADLLGSDETVAPVSPPFILRDPEMGELAALREGSGGNPLLKEAAAKQSQAGSQTKAEKAKWLPEVYLFGMRELSRSDLTVLDPAWAVGFGASLALFDGGMRTHRIRAAEATEQEAALLVQRAREEITLLAEKRYRELLKARERFFSLAASVSLGEENLRTRQLAFREGLATSLDVVDAERALSGIRVERLRSALAFDVSLAEYLEACGRTERFASLQQADAEEVR